MGLVSHALAFGLGYVLGRPGGRQQFVQMGQQVTELAEKPEVKRLAARGRELANDKAHAAKDAVTARVSGKTATPARHLRPPRRLRRRPPRRDHLDPPTVADRRRPPCRPDGHRRPSRHPPPSSADVRPVPPRRRVTTDQAASVA